MAGQIAAFLAIAVVLCCPCLAAEPERKVPFKGDELPFVRIRANPKEYVGKTFVICGGIKVFDYFNFGYSDAEPTHYSLEFLQASKADSLPMAGEDATLYLSRKVGTPIVEKIVAKEEDLSDETKYILVRATVTIIPQRFDAREWAMFELLDVQFVTDDWKDWQKGVLATLEEEKQQKAAVEREQENERQRQIAAERKKQEEALAPKFRVWKDKTEEFQRTAKFVSLSAGKVKLQLEDGKVIEVSVTALCEADIAYIGERKQIALRKKK